MNPVAPDLWGIGAGLLTAGLWSATSLIFEAASRRLGSLRLNLVRLVFAFGFFVLLSLIRWGTLLPPGLTASHWFWLGLSGLVGFVLGDLCLFEAFVLIGAPLAMLVYSSVPFMTALLGWALLGETLGWTGLAGMALCVGGILLAIRQGRPEAGAASEAVTGAGEAAGKPAGTGEAAGAAAGRSRRTAGVGLALLASLAQALGLILSRLGQGDLDSFGATQVRVIPGMLGFGLLWLVVARLRPRSSLLDGRLRDARGLGLALAGALVGPFLGVSLGLYAAGRIGTGLASTLMALVPIWLVLAGLVLPGKRPRPREIAGAVLAVAGVAAMSL